MNVELRHLRAFVAVAEAGNFTRAAEILLIAQPSLSYTINQLEARLNLRLLHRTTRNTTLTEAGVAFLGEARAVLDRHRQALETAGRLAAGQTGSLRVGYLIGAAVDHVPAILRAFGAAYPDIHVVVTEYDFGSPNCGLDDGSSDVAVARPPLDVPALRSHTLLTESRCACVPVDHPLARRERLRIRDVVGEPLVAAPGAGLWRDSWILAEHRPHDAPVRVTGEAATFEAELQAVALGTGVSIVPASASRLYARPGVRFVPITDAGDCEVCVAHRDDAPTAAVHFAQIAARVAAE